MNTYKFALKNLTKNKILTKDEKISINQSLNRVSSSDVFSPVNYPSRDNTAFDGYAINSKETISFWEFERQLSKSVAKETASKES